MNEISSPPWSLINSAEFGKPLLDLDQLRGAIFTGTDVDDIVQRQVSSLDATSALIDEAEALIDDAEDHLQYLIRVRSTLRQKLEHIEPVIYLLSDQSQCRIPRLQAVVAGCFLILTPTGLAVGNLVGMKYILNSGYSMFAIDPLGAMLFFFVTVIMGAFLKAFERFLPNERAKRIYTYLIGSVVFASFALWVAMAMAVFAPGTGSTTGQLLSNALSDGGRLTTMLLMGSHILLDVTGGYVIFSCAERLWLGGFVPTAQDNPLHQKMVSVIEELDRQILDRRETKARARGFLRRFDATREVVALDTKIAVLCEEATQKYERDAAVASANVALFTRPRTKPTRAAALWLLASLAAASTVDAKTTIVVLPPDYGGMREALVTHLADMALTLTPEDRLVVYSVSPPVQIANIAIPRDEKARNPAWVKNQIGAQFAPVIRYLSVLPPVPASGQISENVMMPEVLDEIGRNLVPSLPDKKADILLIGSPFYHDPRDGRFSFTLGYFPSDGHLKASRTETPFGVAGAQDRLKGGIVHLCWPNSQERFTTRGYEEKVRRFWTLWVVEQAAKIGTISYDLASCFKRARTSEASGQTAYTISPDGKIEMLRVRPPVPAALPASMDQPGAWFLRDDVPISRTPPTTTTGVAWIGLKWTAPADIDLYARPDGASPWLFFGNVRTEAGLFNKDHLTATGEGQFEYIEFVRAIDLTKAEAAINLYSGELRTPPEGVVRIWFGAAVYEAPFKLGATRGNRGAPPMSGAHWIRIDLRKVLGLSP